MDAARKADGTTGVAPVSKAAKVDRPPIQPIDVDVDDKLDASQQAIVNAMTMRTRQLIS